MTDVLDQLEKLSRAEVDLLDRDGLVGAVRSAAQVRAWLDAFELRCSRRSRELAAAGESEPPESLLGRCGNHSSRESSSIRDREAVADAMPGFETTLATGEVSTGHLDAIARACRSLSAGLRAEFAMHEPELLAHARQEIVDVFARRCRELARAIQAAHCTSDADELDRQRAAANIRRWLDPVTGMHHIHAELDPVRAAKVSAALDRAITARRQVDGNADTPWPLLQADAFVDAMAGGVITDGSWPPATNASPASDPLTRIDARVPEASVLIDLATLLDGLHDGSVCETDDGVPLPVSTVRRMCCDAEIIPIVLDGHSVPLDVGRSKRTATPGQRRALASMHRTCAHHDCTVPFSQTRIHHVSFWTRDHGPTDLDNLLPLCERHHHTVHEGGWTVTLSADRVATWLRPDGTIGHVGATTDRQPIRSATPAPHAA